MFHWAVKNYPDLENKKYPDHQNKNYPDLQNKKYLDLEKKKYPDLKKFFYSDLQNKNYPDLENKKHPDLENKKYPDLEMKNIQNLENKKHPDLEIKNFQNLENKKYLFEQPFRLHPSICQGRYITEPQLFYLYMSHIMIKPVFAICKQQRHRSVCASVQSDQRFVVHCLDSIIPWLALAKISRL